MELKVITPIMDIESKIKYLTLNVATNTKISAETRTCTKCRKSLSVNNFRKKHNGEITKQCISCLDSHKCEHGKQKNKCKECVGSAFCEHNVIKSDTL